MSKDFFKLLNSLLMMFALAVSVYSQDNGADGIRIMFYNTQNLFDIYDDSLKDDNDFTPGGVLHWNYSRYKKKINSLYQVITAAGEWSPPAVVALCEVENRKVLEDLISNTYLSKYGYRIIHEESSDQRGIDVCLIYRKECAEVLNFRYLIPDQMQKEDFRTRSVLYARLLVCDDTLHLIVNHWPSRRGGALAGKDMRMMIAGMVKEVCDSVGTSGSGHAKIIICGDFNSAPDGVEMKVLTGRERPGMLLFNLSERMAENGRGTYRYKGIWEMIDQIIVSETLLNCKSGLFTGEDCFQVFSPEFLLERDPVYAGFSPFPTYRGYRYHGGFSDHLPVLTDLLVR
jgi:exonuclease III